MDRECLFDGGGYEMQDILDVALEQINDDKQDDRMRPIAHECCTKTAEDDVYRNADGQEEACRDDVHSRQCVDRRCTSDCDTT